MDKIENIVGKLNEMLNDTLFDNIQIESLVKTLKEQFKIQFKLIDFDYYNEMKQEHACKEKLIGIKTTNFDYAARQCDFELECKKFNDFKALHNIEKSQFYYEQNMLFYFHLGNAKNDNLFKVLFI